MARRLLEEMEVEDTHTDFMAIILETFICKEEIKLSIGYRSTADLSSELQLRDPILEKTSLYRLTFISEAVIMTILALCVQWSLQKSTYCECKIWR